MKKAIGYIRVSTNNQDLQRQRTLIKKYCDKYGYTLTNTFEDFAISGTIPDRVGINKVLSLKIEDADMIIVSELSRLSRQDDVMSTLNMIHIIINKFDLVILDDESKIYKSGENLSIGDFLLLAIKAYGAADERKKIITRMVTGKNTKIAAIPLMITDSNIPFGFKAIDNPDYIKGATPKTILAIDENTVEIVKDIFSYIIRGLSLRQITEKLNDMNIKTAQNNKFNHSSVRFIIKNTLYNGYRNWKGNKYKLPFKIIDDETYNLALQKINENKIYNHEAQKHFNPLKGIIKCSCGNNMCIDLYNNKNLVFVCADRVINSGKSSCNNHSIKVDIMLKSVWYDVKNKLSDEDYKNKSNDKIQYLKDENLKIEVRLQEIDIEIDDLQKELVSLSNSISKLTNMNLLKILDAKANEIDSNIAKLKSDSNKLRVEQSNNIYLIDEELSTLKENELTNISLESKAEIFKRLLNKVTYISKELHYGVIILEYKNGITSNIICKTTKQDLSYALPSGFKYLVDTNQFEVQTSPQQPKNKSFNFRTFKPKYYTIKELINSFDLSEYVI